MYLVLCSVFLTLFLKFILGMDGIEYYAGAHKISIFIAYGYRHISFFEKKYENINPME